MSQENVELARRFQQAQRGSLKAAMEFVSEEVVPVEFGAPASIPRRSSAVARHGSTITGRRVEQ
jgi:hypothetical protein